MCSPKHFGTTVDFFLILLFFFNIFKDLFNFILPDPLELE